jgi:hypothetical protein
MVDYLPVKCEVPVDADDLMQEMTGTAQKIWVN